MVHGAGRLFSCRQDMSAVIRRSLQGAKHLFFKRFCVVSLLLLSIEILCHDFSWHDMTVLPLS